MAEEARMKMISPLQFLFLLYFFSGDCEHVNETNERVGGILGIFASITDDDGREYHQMKERVLGSEENNWCHEKMKEEEE